MTTPRWADTLLHTFRYAARAVARTPGFTMTVVITLAVGIGANAAVFSAIDAVLLRPLPFPEADRLVRIRHAIDTEVPIAPIRLEEWQQSNATFTGLTGYYLEDVSDTTGDLPERVRRAVVAPRFLEVLGVAPAFGQDVTAIALGSRDASTLLISDRYWRTRFGGDRGVLGRTIRLDGRSYAVGGVMPPSFTVPDRTVDLWWPYPATGASLRNTTENRQLQWYTGIGRLRSGRSPEQAQADLAVVQTRLGQTHPQTDGQVRVRVDPFKDSVIGGIGASLWLVFAAVSVLLVIACTNIAALLLARATHRQHEVALRLALGATRVAVVGQSLAEALVYSIAGAIGGTLIAGAATTALSTLMPDLPRVGEIAVDARILPYTLLLSIVVAMLCGGLPAFRSVLGTSALTGSGRTLVSTRRVTQWWLVGVQVALSVVLLASAGVLLRSADALARVDPGFEPRRVLAFRVSGTWSETAERGRLVQRIDGTIERLAALPGVESVATSWALPGRSRPYEIPFDLVEGRAESEPRLMAEWRTVSPGYFATLRIPLLAGQLCAAADPRGTSNVMVNSTFARRYFADRSLIGHHLRWEDATQSGRVVGIVADAREVGLDRAPVPTVYACDSAPSPFPWFLVRTSSEPVALASAVRRAIKELEPQRAVYDITPLEARIDNAFAQRRLQTRLLALFAGTALLLSCVGIYGTLSYVVTLRRREVGLRLALGALRAEIVRQFVWQGLRVVGAACLCGLALAVAVTRLLRGMLYEISPTDPLTLTSVVLIVLAVGALAALIPSARAAVVDPMRVLRND